jgi:hypothetical protein
LSSGIDVFTVKPVYKGHLREPANVSFMKLPFIYRFILYLLDCSLIVICHKEMPFRQMQLHISISDREPSHISISDGGPSWSWSYRSWIYNYLYQCLSQLMLWVWILIRMRCTTLCDKVSSNTIYLIYHWKWHHNPKPIYSCRVILRRRSQIKEWEHHTFDAFDKI